MIYKHSKPRNRIQAKANLKRLMPWVELNMKEFGDQTWQGTGISEEFFAHMSEERLSSIHIYPDQVRGWHADLVFDGIGQGYEDKLGNPEDQPLDTKEDEERHAIWMMVSLLPHLRARTKSGYGDAAYVDFKFENATVKIPAGAIDYLIYQYTKPDYTLADLESYARRRLADISDALTFDGATTNRDLRRTHEDDRGEIENACAAALAVGIMEWQPEEPAPPMALRH
ncbi:hypothetical protein [Mesorhizobium sp.]|uniref:hypothetical protein n=1 Tax=Mesorhizobium sp. TaxID=1871066 RepID=UPI00121EA9BC|nr:hypothetical protein [Mesorhizobium sp.]TIS87695.1 MAG: hypothetical protein E5W89_23980 [Mesorhizobium sp.]